MSDLGVALLCGTVLTVWFTARGPAQRVHALLDRWVRTRERPVATMDAVPIPGDLMLATMGYDESWAREQAQQRVRELYAETGDWNTVRAIMAAESQQ